MLTVHRSLAAFLLLFCSFNVALAQTHPVNTQPSPPIVTATASTERVRYIAAGEVHQTRLQVFSSEGIQTYDSGLRLGNLIDWKVENQQGRALSDGTYLFLVTVKDFSNGLTQKYGTATLEQGQVYLEQTSRAELSSTLTTALESNQQAATLSSIDRIGAAGLNRTAAADSPDLTTAANQPTGTGDTAPAPGEENIGGTGTQNKVAKWVDNAGNLGDSIMFDNGNGVAVGTTDLTDILVAGNDRFKIVDGPMTFSFRDFSAGQGYFAIGSSNGIKGFIGHTNNVDGFTLGSFSNHKLTIRTNSVNRLTIDTSGNVGIGTSSPTTRLDVFGNINTSTHYNIGGHTVLQSGGNGTLLVGRSAGEFNASSTFNTFIGDYAGRSSEGSFNIYVGGSAGQFSKGSENTFVGNSAGSQNNADRNSFFGNASGLHNEAGSRNAYFGYKAGRASKIGNDNAFFGSEAGDKNLVDGNSFFGARAGYSNNSGIRNAFFGYNSGLDNATGDDNTYVGYVAGDNSTGSNNSFFGSDAGGSNTSGFSNTFIGSDAGDANVTGSNNTIIGRDADLNDPNLTFATAIGAGSRVSTNNTIVLGRSSDIVSVPGTMVKAAGSFKIDHPLDPLNKTLSHSFVESPDMMNVYNGNVTLDRRGRAVVQLPAYFEALNRDFRYQLTAVGAPGPRLHVSRKVKGNRFEIAGGRPGMEVSWQVTGVRQDAFAEANRIPEVELKPERGRGTYLHPEAFNQKAEAAKKARRGVRPLAGKRESASRR